VITQNSLIFDKALSEQFDKLIYQSLRQGKFIANDSSIFIVIVDALNECEKERNVKAIIDLWSRLIHLITIRLKLFLTSRSELSIQLEFRNISTVVHQNMILQNAVSHTTIQHDIFIFLNDVFKKICNFYNLNLLSRTLLDRDWLDDKRLQALIDMTVSLFVIAAIVSRFVDDFDWDSRERLETILQSSSIERSEQMTQTYLSVLTQFSARLKNSHDKKKLHQEFRMIVESIVLLVESLFIQFLTILLNISADMIALRLRSLHSVLRIFTDSNTSIRTLHLSFNEFLLSDQLQSEPFEVNDYATHRMLLSKCLQLLSWSEGLQENLCKLEYSDKLRREIDQITINDRLSPAFQYACQYWIQHARYNEVEIRDQDDVHIFLQKHFLHWLEAMSLMNRLVEIDEKIRILQSLVSISNHQKRNFNWEFNFNIFWDSQVIHLTCQIFFRMRNELF